MKYSYELNKDDIINILAEKFNCEPTCIYLREEQEPHLMGYSETIKAIVNMGEPALFINKDTSLTKDHTGDCPQSKWEYFSNNGVWTPRCSNCGYVSNYTEYNYCPQCGVKMNKVG